jgi:hypothetical protein
MIKLEAQNWTNLVVDMRAWMNTPMGDTHFYLSNAIETTAFMEMLNKTMSDMRIMSNDLMRQEQKK